MTEHAGFQYQQSDLQCDLCDENRPAVGYCLQCSECLCTACENAHKRSKASKLHEILPKREIPPGFVEESNECRKHDNAPYLFFCDVHQEPCCFMCKISSTKHIGCCLQPINKIATNVRLRIKDLSSKLHEVRQESEKYHRETNESIEQSKFDVQNFQDDMQKELLKVGSSLVNELDEHKKQNDEDRGNISRFCTKSHQKLSELDKLLEFQSKQKLAHRLTFTTKLASQEITQIESDLKLMERLKSNKKKHYAGHLNLTETPVFGCNAKKH